MIFKDGKIKLYLCKVYSYKSILDMLKIFVLRNDFWLKCNLWKVGCDFCLVFDILVDVELKERCGVICCLLGGRGEFFFVGDRVFVMMLNVDWF